jgi:hypothetical protein
VEPSRCPDRTRIDLAYGDLGTSSATALAATDDWADVKASATPYDYRRDSICYWLLFWPALWDDIRSGEHHSVHGRCGECMMSP